MHSVQLPAVYISTHTCLHTSRLYTAVVVLASTESHAAMEGGEPATKTAVSSQTSQSLFQVLYLGHTTVDRHCSPAVMQWIIEELKLRTEQRSLAWLTPGKGGGEGGEGEGRECSTCVCIHTCKCVFM